MRPLGWAGLPAACRAKGRAFITVTAPVVTWRGEAYERIHTTYPSAHMHFMHLYCIANAGRQRRSERENKRAMDGSSGETGCVQSRSFWQHLTATHRGSDVMNVKCVSHQINAWATRPHTHYFYYISASSVSASSCLFVCLSACVCLYGGGGGGGALHAKGSCCPPTLPCNSRAVRNQLCVVALCMRFNLSAAAAAGTLANQW